MSLCYGREVHAPCPFHSFPPFSPLLSIFQPVLLFEFFLAPLHFSILTAPFLFFFLLLDFFLFPAPFIDFSSAPYSFLYFLCSMPQNCNLSAPSSFTYSICLWIIALIQELLQIAFSPTSHKRVST